MDEEEEIELEIDLDEALDEDFDAAAREAVEAVEAVEAGVARGVEPVPTEPPEETIEDQLLAPAAEVEEVRHQLLRTLADFDNFRKRTEREREELRHMALFSFLREFLSVMDNLDRALGAGGSVGDLRQGVEMIHRQMADLLRQHGVEQLQAQGARFDPTIHEAVARVESDVEHPTVVDELQRGYRLRGKLLRPSLVRVAVPADNLSPEER